MSSSKNNNNKEQQDDNKNHKSTKRDGFVIKSEEYKIEYVKKNPPNETYQPKSSSAPYNNDRSSSIEKMLIILSILIVILTFPLSLLFSFVIARHFERVVILRNGKIYKNRTFGPGLIFVLPCVDSVKFIDQRIFCYEVPPQEALTKDSLTVSVDAVVFYKIDNPISAVVNITNYMSSTHFLAATTLRNALGTRNLSEVLTDRPAVSKQVLELMKHVTANWGVNVVRVEIKDIRLPLQLQKAMAAEAESSKLANAKVIVAKAEIEAIKNLEMATDMLMENPMCMQLRYLQSLQTVSGEGTHAIVFPFSLEQVQSIFRR